MCNLDWVGKRGWQIRISSLQKLHVITINYKNLHYTTVLLLNNVENNDNLLLIKR